MPASWIRRCSLLAALALLASSAPAAGQAQSLATRPSHAAQLKTALGSVVAAQARHHAARNSYARSLDVLRVPPAPGVRVEIIGGPDAGKTALTNEKGFYRLDGLATQDPVWVEFSKDGFVKARTRTNFNLVTNQSVPTFQLQANPGPP